MFWIFSFRKNFYSRTDFQWAFTISVNVLTKTEMKTVKTKQQEWEFFIYLFTYLIFFKFFFVNTHFSVMSSQVLLTIMELKLHSLFVNFIMLTKKKVHCLEFINNVLFIVYFWDICKIQCMKLSHGRNIGDNNSISLLWEHSILEILCLSPP